MNWLESLSHLHQSNSGHVIVTVIAVEGSAPRDENSKMVVDLQDTHDSIGGGNLEFEAIACARTLLEENRTGAVTRQYSLGQDLSQCCGGRVTLLFECFPACKFNVILFGAGHVGKSLVTILSDLPCRVTWFDSRPDMFPGQLASNTRAHLMNNPFESVNQCPAKAWYLVMTHSHETDIELCEAILTRGDSRYCGLIGSRSKASSFRSRLKKKGFSTEELDLLTSPIGLPAITGKTPMEVAVSVAAQLLALQCQVESESGSTQDNIVSLESVP